MKQTRFIPIETCGLQLREPQEGQTESRTIEGTPIVFGVRSKNLTPWSDTREVYEVLEPGCITPTWFPTCLVAVAMAKVHSRSN